MKKLFSAHLPKNITDTGLLILRIVVGFLLMTHGFPKLQKLLSDDPIQFTSVFGMTPSVSIALAMFAEFICALLVVVGFATRLATIPILSTMAVIIFVIHGEDPLGHKELPILYFVSYLLVLITGPGKYSLDYLISGRKLETA